MDLAAAQSSSTTPPPRAFLSRLNKRNLEMLFRKGKKLKKDPFLYISFPTKYPTCRFSVIISKKITPLATTRNRLRRQIYEILRLHQHLIQKKFDLAIVVQRDITKYTFEELTKTITSILTPLN